MVKYYPGFNSYRFCWIKSLSDFSFSLNNGCFKCYPKNCLPRFSNRVKSLLLFVSYTPVSILDVSEIQIFFSDSNTCVIVFKILKSGTTGSGFHTIYIKHYDCVKVFHIHNVLLLTFLFLAFSPSRWVRRGLSLDSSLASLLSCFKVGRCWRSPGRPSSNFCASSSSSFCVAFCRGSTTSPTSSASSAACCSPLPSCRTSPSGHLTSTGNVLSLLSRCWPTWDYSPPSSFGFIFTRSTGTGWNILPACLSQASSVKSMT